MVVSKFDVAPTVAAGLIRLARQKAGLTQYQLAGRAGVTQQVVSAYETGRMEPTLPSLQRLLAAAGFEMRIKLEPIDDHDESLERLLESVPSEVRARIEAEQLERVEKAKLDRVRGR